MKFSHQLVISSLAVLVLSACSGSPEQRRQAKDDFEYLETVPFESWTVQEGAKGEFYPNYDIPVGDYDGNIGPDVDIRPPQQILELIPGARSEVKDGVVSIWLLREDEVDNVWESVNDMIVERNIKLRVDSETRLESDWISWESEDEENLIEARYLFERIEANNRYGFQVSLIDWKENGIAKVVSRTNKERYNTFMTNVITSTYDQRLRAEADRKALQLVKQIPISMGKDRSGLPVIIARAPYNAFWQRLTTVLPKLGFQLEERNQSQGLLKAKYSEPDDEFWTSIGTKPLSLESKTYTFLLGDMGNRTSINITDSTGKPVTAEVLESIVPAFAAVIAKEY
ncbi:outer membrane protein assembly factor BamC [Vibrio algarum]|uniref:Outer membrane protein assembly factor BamC n=1 Tax=Vibrio algarum TaxID=3020714 RepID=A0ABT4YST4_9VIBR|nr:outer membrane protein assembly factor BamC [Vibrio sp. KJ40-1]MDB1124578.1 outer membrane protein assembly factor BamC [Vibrio sp. KJ40-1]